MQNKKPVALAGMMGAGKTTVGRLLARRLRLPFHDLDAEIEAAAGKTVAEIFETEGEGAFRDREALALEGLLSRPPSVIALGGGAFAEKKCRALLSGSAVTVWLNGPARVLFERANSGPERPLRGTFEAFEKRLSERAPDYAKADFTVDCRAAPDQIAARIMEFLTR